MQVQSSLASLVARAYGQQIGSLAGATQQTKRAAQATAAPRVDSVGVSSALQEVIRFGMAASSALDIRTDRVAQIRASLAEGSYSFDSRSLAASMLGGAA